MAFSNLIALAIMLATAATLHRQGITQIESAAEAAEALRPIAGRSPSALFAIGIIGTGLLAVPVLAGSAAFAVAEVRGWKEGLEYKPRQAAGFYSIIVAATFIGVAARLVARSTRSSALFWSAVLNGVSAVPIMVGDDDRRLAPQDHGPVHRTSRRCCCFGWAATAVMAAASRRHAWT